MLQRFNWLIEDVLAGCDYPGPEDLDELRSHGIKVVVSLTPRHDIGDLRQAGFEWHEILVEDCSDPSTEQMRAFCELVDECREQGKPVAVHCMAGIGRTGAMLAGYLVWLGSGSEMALAQARAIEPLYVETRLQELALQRFEQELRG